MSKKLIKGLTLISSGDPDLAVILKSQPKNLTLDAGFDLSVALQSQLMSKFKPKLIHEDSFCFKKGSMCATFLNLQNITTTLTTMKKILDETLFAVKTCKKFHSTRINIIKDTWCTML
jgi:Fringe-like